MAANYNSSVETVSRPYFDILSIRRYAKDVLGFEDSVRHPIVISLAVRKLTKGEHEGMNAFVLKVDGDVKPSTPDGEYDPRTATIWCNFVPTDEEAEEYKTARVIGDAVCRWGAYPQEDGSLLWANAPKLREWTGADGVRHAPQSGERYEWDD